MRNALFKLVNTEGGYGLRLVPPADGGEPLRIQEVANYLDTQGIPYDPGQLRASCQEQTDHIFPLGKGECPKLREYYIFNVAEDNMSATARFFPASATGERMTLDEFKNDMNFRMVRFGIQDALLEKHFSGPGYYCTDLPVVKGKPPRHGTDAHIEYLFNTDTSARPEVKEDGSVDFFNLNIVVPCTAGQELARIIPEDPGEPGTTIQGTPVRPREVKKCRLEFGRNIKLSEDRLSILSEVNGHVTCVNGQVFVSDVYEVEDVGTGTGNIDFDGSVQVNGNVNSNFVVKATGDVIVKGVVEGAHIEAGGNIVITRGMKGMSKGEIKAGGNIIAKFFENAKAEAGGYVEADSILHSDITAGTEVHVTSKKGFITGGHVSADSKIEVRTLGAVMGAATVVEVGSNPALKKEYMRLQKEVAEIALAIKNAQPIIQNFMDKKAKGVRFSPEQLASVKQTAANLEVKKKEFQEKNAQMSELAQAVDPKKKAEVHVTGEVYPGTTIIIGDVSRILHDSYKYCRFVREDGDVKMKPL